MQFKTGKQSRFPVQLYRQLLAGRHKWCWLRYDTAIADAVILDRHDAGGGGTQTIYHRYRHIKRTIGDADAAGINRVDAAIEIAAH